MTEKQARRLVKETLEKPFEKAQFRSLVKELLNEMNERKAFRSRGGVYISSAFNDYIQTLERLGQYKDPKGKVIDILIVRLKKESSLERARSKQRNYIAKYLKEDRGGKLKAGALVAFVSPDKQDWRFSFVQINYKLDENRNVKDVLTPVRRYSFLVGKNEKSHTAQSCLLPLLMEDNKNPYLKDLEEAFNVEKVTKEFFEKYSNLFIKLKEAISKIKESDKKIKEDFETKQIDPVDFSKKLLGQIVFLYFLQKKGWFGVEKDEEWGTGSKHFLRELFNRRDAIYKSKGSACANNFFNDILEPLFYEALATEHEKDYYSRFNCRIPFLNGGLFEPINGYDWVGTDILLSDDLFSNQTETTEGDGVLDVFDLYNFTVNEDEPLEKEVAVDPEMLGKVFENLEVKDRKSKGAYYTPREIVYYMCQESLINYLTEELNKSLISKEDIETFIKTAGLSLEHDTVSQEKKAQSKDYKGKYKTPRLPDKIIKHASLIDEKLANIKVCDPAVGSGAFPVGMMNEIIRARKALTPFIKPGSVIPGRSSYHFKRHAIEHCLYGVDIDPGAIEIAKLRLWLSLIVDEEDRDKVQPLPNLDYKIICGDSLLGINKNDGTDGGPGTGTTDAFYEYSLKELHKKKQLYFNESLASKKQKYKKEIDQVIDKVTEGKKLFDFGIYFSEVFQENKGFDVVIANPPYVQLQKNGGKLAKIYQSENYQTFSRTGDIYMLFYEKSLRILKAKGILHFITSNKWMRANYGQKLRDYFSLNTKIINLLDMGADVFDTATVDTNVLLLKNQKSPNFENFKAVNISNTKNYDNIDQYIKENGIDIPQPKPKETWVIINSSERNLKQKIEKAGTALKDWNIKIFRGITTGYNKAFIIDDKTKKELIDKGPDSIKIIKPILRGKDINKWSFKYNNLYLMFIPWHFPLNENIDIIGASKKAEKLFQSQHPYIYKHLLKFKDQLMKRNKSETNIRYEWYALQRCANTYYSEFENEKIIFQEMVTFPSFSYDRENFYCTDTARLITGKNLKFLLSILNSKLFFYSVKHFYGGGTLGNKGVRMKHTFFQHFPVPKISKTEQKPFINLVDNILKITKTEGYLKNPTKKAQVQKYEKQIDQLVYKLYALTSEQIQIIEKNL